MGEVVSVEMDAAAVVIRGRANVADCPMAQTSCPGTTRRLVERLQCTRFVFRTLLEPQLFTHLSGTVDMALQQVPLTEQKLLYDGCGYR